MDRNRIEQRIKQLDAKKQSLKARLRTQERKHDTRRKILIGALVLDRITRNDPRDDTIVQWVKDQLPGFLQRTEDRKLFDELFNHGTNGEGEGEDTHKDANGSQG